MIKDLSAQQQELLRGGRAVKIGDTTGFKGVPFAEIEPGAVKPDGTDPEFEANFKGAFNSENAFRAGAYGAPVVI